MKRLDSYYKHAVKALIPSYGERESQNVVRYWFEIREGLSRMDLVLRGDEEFEFDWYSEDLKLLLAQVPVQYVVQRALFMEELLEVSPTTLIPRPETEELVRNLINYVPEGEVMDVIDVGTGSGCIALGIKRLRPSWNVHGIDIQSGAVEVAARNASLWGVDVAFEQNDLRALQSLDFDIVISNPPYIPYQERTTMEARVEGEEPEIALFVSDHDPLEYYEMLLAKGTRNAPKTSRYFAFEIHEDFGPDTAELAAKYGLQHIVLTKDMQGKDRMIFGRYDG